MVISEFLLHFLPDVESILGGRYVDRVVHSAGLSMMRMRQRTMYIVYEISQTGKVYDFDYYYDLAESLTGESW